MLTFISVMKNPKEMNHLKWKPLLAVFLGLLMVVVCFYSPYPTTDSRSFGGGSETHVSLTLYSNI